MRTSENTCSTTFVNRGKKKGPGSALALLEEILAHY